MYERAIAEHERLVEENPDDIRLIQKLGELYQKAGDNIKAAAAFARVAAMYEGDGFFLKAIPLLKQTLVLDPARSEINFRLADLHHSLGLLPEALAFTNAGIDCAHRRHDAAAALAGTKKLIALDPTQPKPYIALAQSLLSADQNVEAQAALATAVELLRASEPRVAAMLEHIELGGPKATALAALRAVRMAIAPPLPDLSRLDFSKPN